MELRQQILSHLKLSLKFGRVFLYKYIHKLRAINNRSPIEMPPKTEHIIPEDIHYLEPGLNWIPNVDWFWMDYFV